MVENWIFPLSKFYEIINVRTVIFQNYIKIIMFLNSKYLCKVNFDKSLWYYKHYKKYNFSQYYIWNFNIPVCKHQYNCMFVGKYKMF